MLINRRLLIEATKKVVRIISNSTTVAIAKGVLCEFGNGNLKLTTTDLTTSMVVNIPCDTGMFNISFVIDGKLFYDIINKLPSEEIEISLKDKEVTIKGDRSIFKLSVLGEIEDFPSPEATLSGKKEITLPSNVFKDLVFKTASFVSIDETRPTLSGVKIEIENKSIKGISLDGYRLGYFKKDNIEDSEKVSFVVKGETLQNVARSLDGDVKIVYSDNSNYIGFKSGTMSLYTVTLEGNYFDYQNILKPEEVEIKLKLKTESLKDAIERISVVSRQETKMVPTTFHIEDGELVITASGQIGNVVERIKLDAAEGEMNSKVAFNPRYILEGLKSIVSEMLSMRFNGSINPGYLVEEEQSFIYLILPIRLSS